MNIFEPSSLALAVSLGVIALSSVMGFSAAGFRLRQARLPDATAYEDIRERRIAEEKRIADLRAEARAVEQQIKEKDRLVAEVASLLERREAITMELANLDSARAEIEDVKREAADAAGELATALQECRDADEKLAEIEDQIGIGRRQLETLPERIAALEESAKSLQEEKRTLETELPKLRIERDSAIQRIEEARAVHARRASLDLEIENLEDQIAGLSEERETLSGEAAELRAARDEHARLREDVGRIEARRNSLEAEVADLDERRAAFGKLKAEMDEMRSSVSTLREHRAELEESIARLEARRERSAVETGEKTKDTALLLGDIRQFPACLAAPALASRAQKTETETLAAAAKYLKECGLEYDYRTVQAFHTCLKINDHAQITVLAGVSGTGKSMLPRRYAEAMGIHFHQIAVEPRWDSPQDLLGFYNYIEQKYRATDLARLLVHMDPYHSVPVEETTDDRRDHMALVLLDEMNLARVEYYFSEFLSRLEVRPRLADAGDEIRRKNAMIPIDIRGYDKTLALFPGHNVLFAGTMNDDESTQALSDKVLDRGNVIQFAAPKKFNIQVGVRAPSVPNEALSFSTWGGWIRNFDGLGASRETADKLVVKLASIMDDCGRPFGHRLRDAILSYAANYPKGPNGARDIRDPLIDQIELRILPKLRGLEIDGHASPIADLVELVRELGDAQLADRLDATVERQKSANGLFVWRGLTRSPG